jgi:hypothetical protein
MPVADMVDVVHYLFEHDSASISSAEQLEARDVLRRHLYKDLYEKEYKYSVKSGTTGIEDLPFDEESFDDIVPIDPLAESSRKAFIPATSFNPNSQKPFGSVLDGPLK